MAEEKPMAIFFDRNLAHQMLKFVVFFKFKHG
jgi:hypothetical protein